jgi:hypothetical protein
MKMSQKILCGITFLSCLNLAHATSNVAKDIDTYFGEAKIQEIKTNHLGPVEKHISKLLDKPVSLKINTASFKGVTYDGSQELGSSVQTMGEVMTKMSEDAGELSLLKSKLNQIDFKYGRNTVPKFTFKAGVLVLEGAYGQLEWSKAGKVSEMIKTVMK